MHAFGIIFRYKTTHNILTTFIILKSTSVFGLICKILTSLFTCLLVNIITTTTTEYLLMCCSTSEITSALFINVETNKRVFFKPHFGALLAYFVTFAKYQIVYLQAYL